MPSFHYVEFRAFCHATEDPERVRHALQHVVGDEEADVTETHLEGHFGNPILWLEVKLTRSQDVDAFFKRVAELDKGVIRTLANQVDRRLDDNLGFYFRFGKQEAYQERLVLSHDEDAVQVRCKVAAYPAKRKRALAVLGDYFEDLAPDQAADA